MLSYICAYSKKHSMFFCMHFNHVKLYAKTNTVSGLI